MENIIAFGLFYVLIGMFLADTVLMSEVQGVWWIVVFFYPLIFIVMFIVWILSYILFTVIKFLDKVDQYT